LEGVRVVTLNGGLTPAFSLNPYDAGGRMAFKFGSNDCYYIHAPAIAVSNEICEVFKSDMTVRQALELADQARYFVVGIGPAGQESTLYQLRYISVSDMESLRQQGAVGDIVAQFFDYRGEKVACALHERVVAFPIEKLKGRPNVIAVASGAVKVPAIVGALRGRLASILVTDEDTAGGLITYHQTSKEDQQQVQA
jgi:DNA-binding transcriptional regulator LsrR (DeoR family)